jgi:hypothetical protein
MDLPIRDSSKIMSFMAMASTNGLTVEHLKVTGNTTKCMEKDFSLGTTAEDMKENISMIRSTVKAYSFGLMVVSMMVAGPMENKKVLEHIQQRKARSSMVNGKPARRSRN